jgi:hypothetical protein
MFSTITLNRRRFLTVEEKAARDAEKALIVRNIRLAETEAIARSTIVNVAKMEAIRVEHEKAAHIERSKVVKMEATRVEREKAAYLGFKSDIAELKTRLKAKL